MELRDQPDPLSQAVGPRRKGTPTPFAPVTLHAPIASAVVGRRANLGPLAVVTLTTTQAPRVPNTMGITWAARGLSTMSALSMSTTYALSMSTTYPLSMSTTCALGVSDTCALSATVRTVAPIATGALGAVGAMEASGPAGIVDAVGWMTCSAVFSVPDKLVRPTVWAPVRLLCDVEIGIGLSKQYGKSQSAPSAEVPFILHIDCLDKDCRPTVCESDANTCSFP